MSTHKCITNPNMRLPKRKSPKKNNMSQLFFSKTGFYNFSEAISRSLLFGNIHVGNHVDQKRLIEIGKEIGIFKTVICDWKQKALFGNMKMKLETDCRFKTISSTISGLETSFLWIRFVERRGMIPVLND